MNLLVYFIAVILKVLLVNLLAALNFAVFLKLKNVWKIKKTLKNVKKRDQNKTRKKRFLHLCLPPHPLVTIQREQRPIYYSVTES